jgi:Mob1/phocein family
MSHHSSPHAAQILTPPRPLNPVFSPVERESRLQPLIISSSPFTSQSEAALFGRSQNAAPPANSYVNRLFRAVFQTESPSLSSLLGSSTSSQPQDEEDTLQSRPYTYFLHRNSRTRSPFKPQKAGRGTSSWQLKEFAEATLGSGSLRKAVKLPEGEDENEWLAVNGKMVWKM